MKKNSKGFTLVELLAAIVILGILLVFAAPTVLNLVEKNKNKMYVDAAKKLISRAEYEIRANSSKIEKPDKDDVIVLSLVYLDDEDFDNAPGNGEYIKEASFVVVKNTGSGLEYSATIVEKLKKGGYKGIDLTRNDNLLSKNADRYVKAFEEKDIVFVTKNSYGKVLSKSYIDEHLGMNYCNSVSEIYNYRGLDDDSATSGDVGDSVTGIKNISIVPASDKGYNSFDAVLSVEVGGDKESRKDVKVYTSTDSYTDAKNTLGASYGAADVYTKTFDFSTLNNNKYDGKTYTVYVVVKDKAGNSSEKKVNYELHTNVAPIIDVDNSGLSKKSGDSYNMPKASLKLVASDDVDETKNLSVCITPVMGRSCSDYKKYSDYFGESGTMEYDFGGTPDGRGVELTVYVKDTSGLVTHADFEYKIYENKAPSISNVTITSESEKFTTTGNLKTKIKLTATDDFPVSNLKVRISSDEKSDVELRYDEIGSNSYSYTFAGNYDGDTRDITFYITDEYGETASITKQYQVYENKAPEFLTATLTSNGTACPNKNICPVSKGGSIDALVNVSVKDDIDYANDYANLKICVSEEEEECDPSDLENFKDYSYYRGKGVPFSVSATDDDDPYDGTSRTIYYSVIDTYGEVTTTTSEYKLYKNQAPSNVSITIQSNKDPEIDDKDFGNFLPINLNSAKLILNVEDDWGTENLEVDICKKTDRAEVPDENEKFEEDEGFSEEDEGDEIIEEGFGEECEGYMEYQPSYDIDFNEEVYDGQEYSITVRIKDKYGSEVSESTTYTLYSDKAPVIENFKLKSTASEYNSGDVLISYTVKDALDNYSICIGPDSKYDTCAEQGYYVSSDGEFSNKQEETDMSLSIPYDSNGKTVYLVVRDSHGNVVFDEIEYEIYKYCTLMDDSVTAVRYYLEPISESEDDDDPEADENIEAISDTDENDDTTTETGDGDEEDPENPENPEESDLNDYISAYSCKSKCYKDETNPLEITYYRVVEKRDLHFPDHDCSDPSEEVIKDCSFHMCYAKDDTTFYMAVGTNKVELDWTHEVEVEDEEEVPTEDEELVLGEEETSIEDEDIPIGEEEELPKTHMEEHVHSYYYKIYKVTYDEKLDQIIFTETAEKACPDLFDSGYYFFGNDYVLTKD